jgi:hypothetical protein
VEGSISADEYKAKKASLINKKTHHLENPEGTGGKWLEPIRDFLTLAHQASYVASAGSAEEKADYIKKTCSNRRLAYASLSYSYTYTYKMLVNSRAGKLRSQCCVTRGILSLNTGLYYSPNIRIISEIRTYREVFPRVFVRFVRSFLA